MTHSIKLMIRGAFMAAALVAVATSLWGCGRNDPRSAAEIKADLVDSMLKGYTQPGLTVTVSAEHYDQNAQELRGVHVTGKQGVLYADRATITVDEKTKAIRMKLFDVIVAQPADGATPATEGSRGHMVKYRELVLEDLNASAAK